MYIYIDVFQNMILEKDVFLSLSFVKIKQSISTLIEFHSLSSRETSLTTTHGSCHLSMTVAVI